MNTSHEHGQSFQCRVTSEAVTKTKSSPEIVFEELENVDSSQLESLQPKQKILIQRVFHQPTKDVVEQKLDYIVAKSDEEITKHVFGGLFKNKYYPYKPENYCLKHDQNLFEHYDETLLKIGDKFDSLETFRLYIDSNAKHWKYYLKCADSHRGNGKSTFVYKCVFAGSRLQYFNAKGLRKRTAKVPKSNCPCRVILKAVPENADTLTVIYVCNHHDHPLTDEYFYKLQHGRRINPSVKEEIMDLLSLDVDREVIKKYCESLTGYKMDSLYFINLFTYMKKNNIERQFTLEKLKEISRKVERIKEELGIADVNGEEETVDNDLGSSDKASQIQEAINVLRSVTAPKKPPPKPKPPRNPKAIGRKRPKIMKNQSDEELYMTPPVNSVSRLEARLQELTYDHETLQSIKHLQDSVRGEADDGSLLNSMDPWNRINRIKRTKNTQKLILPDVEPNLEPQTVVIENTQNIDAFEENQEIIYENEVTVMETPVENYNEILVYENQDENNGTDIVDPQDEVRYCVQYEDDTMIQGQPDQQYILMEELENVPEVRIQATDLATVSIVSKNEDAKDDTVVKQEQILNEIVNETPETPNVENDDRFGDEVQTVKIGSENITVLGDADGTLDLETDTVYEVIKTNDKKIMPCREVVRSVILNIPSKSKKSTTTSDATPDSPKRRSDAVNNRLIQSLVKEEDLDELEDDEYYMVVVNDHDDENSQSDDTGNLGGEFYNLIKKEYDYESVEESEPIITKEENLSESGVQCVNKKVQCSFVSAKDIEREVKAIKRLKRMRQSLERDVKRLVATKDELVKKVMKARRLKRPFKDYD